MRMKALQPNQVSFLCSIADNDNAIRVSGSRNGLKLLLDIPESDIDAYLPLVALRGYPLKITIAIDTQMPVYAPDRATID